LFFNQIHQEALFNDQSAYYFDITINPNNGVHIQLTQLSPLLLYDDPFLFSFKFSQKLTGVLHGSCRKAHFDDNDALPQLDKQLHQYIDNKDVKFYLNHINSGTSSTQIARFVLYLSVIY
jgi:hypothetical protein